MIAFIEKYWNKINPSFRGIVLFVICLFASNYLWEFTVSGEETEDTVAVFFLNCDISPFFKWGVLWFANSAHLVLNLFGVDHAFVNNSIFFANGNSMRVVAGCTAFKQFFIAACILFFSRGPWLRKLWYVPLSVLVLVGFNIFRLVVLSLVVRDHIELFDLFHLRILKYMFYATILLLWYLWDEHIRLYPKASQP